MSLSKTIDVVNQADNLLGIPREQAAHLAWLQQATAKRDSGRHILEFIKVDPDGDEAMAVDGFRIHAIRVANRPASVLHQLADRLVFIVGKIFRNKQQLVEYVLADSEREFPVSRQVSGLKTVRVLLHQKPLAVLCLDPRYVRQALQDATAPVVIKVYDNGTGGSLVEFFAEEDGVRRYALVMGMTVSPHLIDRLSWRPEELNHRETD